eukprot:1632621-Amphidinium_carterae.1
MPSMQQVCVALRVSGSRVPIDSWADMGARGATTEHSLLSFLGPSKQPSRMRPILTKIPS